MNSQRAHAVVTALGLGLLVMMIVSLGCSKRGGGTLVPPANDPTPVDALVDPHISWTLAEFNCADEPLVGEVTYNVYTVEGEGPIPTRATPDESPCGVRQLADIAPMNSEPITGDNYNALVPNGTWTFALEACLVTEFGTECSSLSEQVTVVVLNAPAPVQGVLISLLKEK